MYYNRKIGYLQKKYDKLLLKNINNIFVSKYQPTIILNKTKCSLIYPIFYKKISFFQFYCDIVKQKNMRNQVTLNQSVILETAVSRNKCVLWVPVNSFINLLV